MKRTLFLIIVLLTMRTPLIKAQQNHDNLTNYLFSYITVEDGLSNNFIDDLYKDKQGFMWIVTYGGGLLRYDGYDFLHYNVNSIPAPIKSNFVKKVCEDNFHRLWIASEGGIDVISMNTMISAIPQSTDSRLEKILNAPSTMIIKDSKGCIWMNSQTSIVKIEFNSKGNISAIHQLKNTPSTSVPPNAFCEVNNQMLVGYNNIIYKVVTDHNGNLLTAPILNFKCSSIICITKNGDELWVGTDNGLYRINNKNRTIRSYFHNEADPHSITQNFITNIYITSDHQVLVSTLNGLNLYNPISDCFTSIVQDEKENLKTLNCNFIHCVLCDGSTIWIGTEAGGLNKMTKRMLPVKNYTHIIDNSNTISKGQVNSVYQEPNGNIWVGCIEGGLNYKTAASNKFIHFTTANGLSHNSVSVIIPIPDGHLWLGTWGEGIDIFDKSSKRVIGYVNSHSTGYNIDFIGSMIYDSINNGIWIGSNRGIFFYDLSSKHMSAPIPSSYIANINGCLGITVDKYGVLWMGNTNGTLTVNLHSFKKNRKHFICTLLKANLDRSTAFLNKATCFLQAANGTLWIGTNGYGLVKVNRKAGKYIFSSLNSSNGLCNDIITQMLEDPRHHLWMATANGLSCLNPITRRFINYYKQDGLCCNQFFWNGSYKSPNSDHLFFGNINGLVDIDTGQLSQYCNTDKVVLTMLTVGDKNIFPENGHYLNINISQAKKINLHEHDKSFSIEFSALNYDTPSSITYQYRLKGFNDKWTNVSANRRFATYTNLPSGTYTFQVRCASGSKEFSNNITEIEVHVSPYFYKTWWFIILMIGFIGFMTYRGFKWRINILKKQKVILQNKVEQRTAALENQTKELSIRNNILVQQNEKITKQKTQLVEMAKKVQELTVDKLAFFTNITHEFRTPITLIIGPIERALKLSTNSKVIEQLNFVEKSSKQLLSLINQLMDFRKVESGNLRISCEPGNIMTFIDDLILPFKALADDKSITLRPIFHIDDPFIMFDKEAMTKIITNLLSNSMKFTLRGGSISIYIATLRNSSHLYICVSDTGKGIVKNDVEKIFNRFYQSKGNENNLIYGQSGTGIGLYLCKRIATLLGGNITARNNPKNGASFRLLIPLIKLETQSAKPTIEQTIDALNDVPETQNNERLIILIVEDNNDMRKYIRSILSDTYTIVEAADGREALSCLKNQPIDFIISDLMMPEMDGIQLSHAVKNDFTISHIPFLMLTAKTAREAQLESFKNGVDDYILKPFDEEMLKARIKSILENRDRFRKRFKMNMVIDSLHIDEDSSDKKFIDKAIQIIKRNYKNSYYEVSDFVEAMGISKSLLNKKMQTLTGQTPGQFIRNYRLNLAKEIIMKNRITHNMNVSEIAYEVGFNDPKYFTRCFTKHFNITPSNLLEDDIKVGS